MLDNLDSHQILDSAPDGFLVVCHLGTIVWANQTAGELFRYSREQLIGRTVEDLVPGRFRDHHVSLRNGYHASPRSRPMGLGMELRALRSDGTEFPVEISLSLLAEGPEPMVTAIVRDVSERHALEQERNRLAMDLQTERERDRIAMDLHDGIMQDIYASSLSLEVALSEDDVETRDAAMERVIDQLHQVIRNIRSYIFDLRPREFGGNLIKALQDMAREFQQNSQIETETIVQGEGDLALETAVALYNVAHESLSNVQRHARAHHVTIQLTLDKEHGCLVIKDDGVGFDPAAHVAEEHRGLRNMAARVRIINGTLTIESTPGSGATFRIDFPIDAPLL